MIPEDENTAAGRRVRAYAEAVVSGSILAGPFVRDAGRRHLEDLATGAARGLRFDEQAAGRAIRFFEVVLRVRMGREMIPFFLLDWQAFVVGSLFGWLFRHGDGSETRRFSEAYIETGKGSGKSPLAAGIGHYLFLADGELEPEIYAAATKKDQAMVLFRDAVSMVNGSRALRRRIVKSGKVPVWQLSDPRSGGFFKPLSNDDAQSGPRPSCGLVDEFHEHKTSDTLEMLKAGFKGRVSPLLFIITNSGSDVQTPCYELHEHALKVASGDVENDGLFAYVCGMDEGDDPMEDEGLWIKGNPSLGVVVGPAYVRRAVSDAKLLPSRENKVRRLYFCEWTDAPESWIRRGAWATCERSELALSDFARRPCFAGLDLSYTSDLSALALAFPDAEGGIDLFVEFWKAADVLEEHEERDRVKYRDWAKRGFLHAPPGKVLKTRPVAQRLAEIQSEFDLQMVAYDRYRLKDFAADLEALGLDLPMLEHPQGFRRGRKLTDPATGEDIAYPLWMPESVQLLENSVIEGTLRVAPNPVLRWNVSSAKILEDPGGTGNRILDKRRSTGRIDGAVASAMAVGGARSRPIPKVETGSYLEAGEMVVL
ncbi:terminase large subunit [Neomegalonema sp.]|uniref:terminase large subunit n=1 Tax=Neomegalonema sp. TaxID=2039713 RepID=UPI0026189633|nr:terminase large subunit [Neomegalonema sp.]MDD2870228.1 terminase large subunit [Neomegalonema sp.]